MRVFITGGTGLIGRRVIEHRRGDTVIVLTRNATRARQSFIRDADRITFVEGDATEPGDWQHAIDGCDAAIHLAGAGIADKRWNADYKKLLIDSRVDSGRRLIEGIEMARQRPAIVIGASAIGIYGDTGETIADESTESADDFLADLCVAWEESVDGAAALGARVVTIRIGVVLDPRGGALEKMVPPVKWFVGGPIGDGKFFMSWIHHADLAALVAWCLQTKSASGVYNAVSPHPVQNKQFMQAIGGALNRPCWLPVPPPALRLVMGELAKHVTASTRVVPARAQDAGFTFRFEAIEAAMADVLGDG